MEAGIIGIVIVLFLIAVLRMPIAFALFMVGIGGLLILFGFDGALRIASIHNYGALIREGLPTIILFVLIGTLTVESGIGKDAYDVCDRWLGRQPGGLAMATLATATGFAACCGSTIAATSMLAKLTIPEMKRFGYADTLACGSTAAGALLAVMIPPSGAMVIYGIITGESIGKLLIAGILPGLVLAILSMTGISVLCRIKPSLGPRGQKYSWKERISYLPRIWGIVLIILVIVGGIMFGIATPSEAAALACLVTFISLISRKRARSVKPIVSALKESARISSFVIFLIAGAIVFGAFITLTGMPLRIVELIGSAGIAPMNALILVLLIYIPLGMFLDVIAMMLITIPIFYPLIVTTLGFNGIWFGVLVVMMLELAGLTPPIGMSCFIISGVTDLPLDRVFKGVSMFIGLHLIGIVILIAFPEIALFLPNLMGR